MPDSALIGEILKSAGAGTAIIVILILTGILNTKRYTERVEKDAQFWKEAAETERKVSAAAAAAAAAAAQRADAAIEVTKLTTELLEDLRRRTGETQKG